VAEELTVLLVRHGESEWNVEGRLQGQIHDVQLSSRGRQQAIATAKRLSDSRAGLVVTSDSQRAAETARTIASHLVVPLHLNSDLREQALGVFEGRLAVEVRKETGYELWQDTRWRPPGGESLQDVYARLQRFFDGLKSEYAGRRVVVVTHGDTARVADVLLRCQDLDGLASSVMSNGEFKEYVF